MKDEAKIVLFERKEVVLLFLIVSLFSATSFVLGVRLGKSYTDLKDGFLPEDKARITDLKSEVEESYEMAPKTPKATAAATDTVPEAESQATYKALKEEFEKIGQKGATTPLPKTQATPAPKAMTPALDVKKPQESGVIDLSEDATPQKGPASHVQVEDKQNYLGKYTIQLGSYPTQDEAEKFADGFRIRGYSPVINEVKLRDKGTWYRVGLGVFGSIPEAKDYISKEDSLFRGTDYVIVLLN